MTFIYTVYLTGLQSILFVMLCAWLIWRGQPEWVLGIYLSMALWTRAVIVFGVAHTWVLLATMLASAAVFILKTRPRLRFPTQDRWIIGWLTIWTVWMLFLIALYRPDTTMPILRGWVLNTLLPLPIILLFVNDLRRIRGFAVAFLSASFVSGWFSLAVLHIPLEYLRYDPTLQSFGVIRLNIENYHFFGFCQAIALILAVGLFVTSKSTLARFLILLASVSCAYFLVLSGSKQSILSGAVTVVLLIVWAISRRRLRGWQTVLAMSVPIVVGVILYLQAPSLVLRSDSATLSEVLSDSFAGRTELWTQGLGIFWRSPLWGVGFSQAVFSHNLFISTLADQGLVGFAFFVGFLVFLTRQIRAIGSRKLSRDGTVWYMVFACLAIFCLLRGLVSSAVYSSWELFWASAFLWLLRPSPTKMDSSGSQ